jgi:hypothetical protein
LRSFRSFKKRKVPLHPSREKKQLDPEERISRLFCERVGVFASRQQSLCPVCFNTRLDPGVLEALTALDLGAKFKENEKLTFENVSEDDYANPPEASYFSHVLERKKKLESLYDDLLHTVGTAQETEAVQRLINAAISS